MLNDKWEILRKPNQEIVGIKYNGVPIDVSKAVLEYDVDCPLPVLSLRVLAYDIVFTEVPDA